MFESRLQETSQYRSRRKELQQAEIALMRHREQVAVLRRRLPADTVVEDYVFTEGPRRLGDGDAPTGSVKLSELFSSPERPLVIYHLMYGKAQTTPCPMCTLWVDGFDGVAHHLAENVDFAIAAAADLAPLRAHARSRGWDRLRLLSCGESTFKLDLGSEDEEGNQDSTVSVFILGADGSPRHWYSTHPRMSADLDQRGIDLLCPLWHLLDLTPQGRGDWYASLDYGEHLLAR
ncbi:MAG TPA: DUF899 family protein [Acidimicrobiales bacterium]|nr:DUF899 family protein [Acidimicrobiales bacterium]